MKQRLRSTLFPSNRPQSLRWRLLTLLGGMLLVTLLVIGTSVFFFIYQNEEHAWQGRQQEAARHAAHTVAEFIDHTKNTLTLVSLIERDDLIEEPRVMTDLIRQTPALLEMLRLDKNGQVVASSFQDKPLLASLFTLPQSRWFIESQAGQLHLSEIQISANSEPYIIIAIPAPDEGVVAARLNMNVMWGLVADLRFGESGQVYIVNHEGLIVAHPDREVTLAKIRVPGKPDLAGLSPGSDFDWNGSYLNFAGNEVIGVAHGAPDNTWITVTEISQAEAFAVSQTALLLITGGLALFGLLVLLVTSRFMEQLLIEPMEKLRAGTVRIGQGDLQYQIDIFRRDEVGQVAAAFNEMARRLHARDQELATKTAALTVEIVERKQAEAALRQLNNTLEQRVLERTAALEKRTEDLLRSNKELEKFAYVASHDLQEPLRKVQAFGDRLQGKYADVLDERGRNYLERMRGASARMQTLINDLLTFSRVTTKAQPFVPLDLSQVAQDVLSDLEVQIERVGGQVEVDPLPSIEADPFQIRQLLQNLVSNALKFHRDDEPPFVKIQANHLPPHPNGSNGASPKELCQIIVADNGIGFDLKYHDRIFQVFQRLHGRTAYEGTGVGLAICRKIVERHQGNIMAESEPGQGAKFIITLPVKQPKGDK